MERLTGSSPFSFHHRTWTLRVGRSQIPTRSAREGGVTAMGRLKGKTALVTGASRGIGRAIAIELAREGAKVALNYQSSDAKAQEVAEEIARFEGSCVLAKANLANPQEARAMVKRV